jgi:hypothetical protein
MAGIGTVSLALFLTRSSDPNASQASQVHAGKLTPAETAKALVGRRFTRAVVPPELALAGPFRDVFVTDAVPGLVGESSTTTSDLGGTVTIYVFADPAWAQAFYESPPAAYGCGVCTSMADGAPVQGIGNRATSYVLYRKTSGGQSWIATTTYLLSGSVVINGLYFPVNIANPYPTATDLSIPTAYARAGLQLINNISG